MLAFGGAGPVHACYVAERLDSTQVIYPPMASVLSAFGTLVTPARLDLVRGVLSSLEELDWSLVDSVISSMLEEGEQALLEAGIAKGSVDYAYAADMRYSGQQDEITVNLTGDPRAAQDVDQLERLFEKSYEALYGVCLDDMSIEVVCWRVTALGTNTGREANVSLADTEAPAKSVRSVFYDDKAIDVPVYDRAALAAGQQIEGPVILEERETTAFILPYWSVMVHVDGSLIATRQDKGEK